MKFLPLLALALAACTPMQRRAPAEPVAAMAEAPSDAEIAAVLAMINHAEIEMAKLARAYSLNSEVADYAERMIEDHAALNERALSVFASKGLVPVDSTLTADMKAMHAQKMEVLRSLRGDTFDMAYMALMVDDHATALHLIDTRLLPAADDARLRALLVGARPTLVSHRAHAERVLEHLEIRTAPVSR